MIGAAPTGAAPLADVGVTGSTSLPLAGSATITSTPAGSLGKSSGLSGTSSVSLAPTGSLGRTAALSGSSAIALTPSGSLGLAAVLSGTSAIAIAASGALGLRGQLAGSTPIAINGDGGAIGGGRGPVVNPYLPLINQNDESFRRQLIAIFSDINQRIANLEYKVGS